MQEIFIITEIRQELSVWLCIISIYFLIYIHNTTFSIIYINFYNYINVLYNHFYIYTQVN